MENSPNLLEILAIRDTSIAGAGSEDAFSYSKRIRHANANLLCSPWIKQAFASSNELAGKINLYYLPYPARERRSMRPMPPMRNSFQNGSSYSVPSHPGANVLPRVIADDNQRRDRPLLNA